MDNEIKGIITAIGGLDTYKTIEFLMEDEEFIECVKNNPKIFTGFSDTTNNHWMLNKLGLSTFYGPCLLVDLAELDKEMIPYTKKYFELFMGDGKSYEIESSEFWYEERPNYGVEQIGIPRIKHKELNGYEVLNGSGVRNGKLFGGCIETIYKAYTVDDRINVYKKYNLYPSKEEWKEKILFLETSEGKSTPEELEKILLKLKEENILSLVQGVIVGKPIDEIFYEEYKEVYKRVFSDLNTPVLYNVNFGHSCPRCILPYDVNTTVDYDNKKIIINENILN